MNSDGRPSRGMIANESGSGVCDTSAPRMLKVQATACGSDTTSASAFSFAISGRTVESFVSAASPAKRMSCSVTAPSGGAGRSVHNSSIGLGSIGTSVAPALAQARRELLRAFDGVQPRIEAERVALAERALDPLVGRRFDQMHDLEQRRVDLLARLQRVAAVDEQRRTLHQHDRGAGRAGEAGEPGEPLLRSRQIFALVAIGMRHRRSR